MKCFFKVLGTIALLPFFVAMVVLSVLLTIITATPLAVLSLSGCRGGWEIDWAMEYLADVLCWWSDL